MNLYDAADKMSVYANRLMVAYKTSATGPAHMPGAKKLTPIEEELLGLLEWRDNLIIKDVINILKVANSTITSAVNRLESKGLVRRISTQEDKRAFHLKLTQNGQDLVNFNKFKKTQFFFELLEGLSDENEGQMVIQLLEKMTQSLDEKANSQQRRGHMNALQKEYYDFGPWLIEIKNQSDIPQQYMMHKDEILNAPYCFKVPIKKEWRHIHPGMLLYKTVVVVEEKGIIVMSYENEQVVVTKINADEVRYIVHSTDLLDSHIILGTDKKIIDIDYNCVSQEISDRVINALRKNIYNGGTIVDLSEVDELTTNDSPLYNEILNRGLKEEVIKVIAFQPSLKLEKHHPSTSEVLLMTHNKYELQDVIFASNGKELIVISRNRLIKKRKETDYSFRHTFFKLEDITDIVLANDTQMEHCQSLSVYSGDTSVVLKVGEGFDVRPLKRLIRGQ